jgi:hypothetical protein
VDPPITAHSLGVAVLFLARLVLQRVRASLQARSQPAEIHLLAKIGRRCCLDYIGITRTILIRRPV